jgi:uncharacterized membrane protein
MSKWFKIAALTIAAIAVVVLAYAVLTPQESTDSTDHMGMWGRATYSTENVGLIAVSVVVIVASIMILAFWNKYEPLPPSMSPSQMQPGPPTDRVAAESKVVPALAETKDADAAAAHNYLVLRLLSGDERTMYKALMDSGGESLQKDLIQRTKMSNAKVSRVLDRLVEKDIILKERYGATNKVRIRLDR